MDEMSLDNRHKWARPYWARPGVSLIKGAGKGGSSRKRADEDDEDDDPDEEDDEDEDDDDPDEDEDDEDDDDLADLTEDELKAELRKTRDRLSKASGSASKKRKQLRDLRAKGAASAKPAAKKPAGKKDDEDAPDLDAIRAAAESEANTKANERIVKAEARGALKAAGIPGAQVGRLVGMLKLDEVDIDDDGEVDEDSLDEAIEALRKDWPQLFTDKEKKTPRTRVAGAGDRDGKGGTRKKYTATERQVAAALGKKLR